MKHLCPSFISACLLALTFSATAQKGNGSYVVTPGFDTTYGTLTTPVIGKPRLITPTEKVVCDPATFISYYDSLNRAIYRSATLPNAFDKSWLRLIEDGAVQLLEQVIERPGGSVVNWYASKQHGALQTVKTVEVWGSRKTHKGALQDYMQDDTLLLHKLDALETFKYEDIRYLVKLYNKRAGVDGRSSSGATPPSVGHAKPGTRDFALSLSGDTLFVSINPQAMSKHPRASYEGKNFTLPPAQYRAYYTAADQALYESLEPLGESGYQWYQVTEQGAITLYQRKLGHAGDCLVLKAGDDVLTEMNTTVNWGRKARKARLLALIADDEALFKALEKAEEMNAAVVQEVIGKYNKRVALR